MKNKLSFLTLLALISLFTWMIAGQPKSSAVAALPEFSHESSASGYADLIIAVPGRAAGTLGRSGSVVALFGTENGIATDGSQYFDRLLVGAGAAQEGSEFGKALAAGDFDGDGDFDLAIGAPGETVGGAEGAGAVYVLYRMADGYHSHAQFWHQGLAGMGSAAEAGDHFGYTLAGGDFNADGYTDLAVSVPYDSVGDPSISRAGGVQVLYGSGAGLVVAGIQGWYQDAPGIEETAEQDDCFGETLASGDFDADGFSDLAVGVPQENIGASENAGAVHVIYGSSDGLTEAGDQVWNQGAGIQETAEAFDLFGSALAAGDFDGDGDDDLAIGASQENLQAANEGVVHILAGAPAGMNPTGNQYWHQGLLSPEQAEDGDMFAAALESGDFNNDGYADLAIGAPREDTSAQTDAGMVHILYGSASLFAAGRSQVLLAPTPSASSLFGAALAAGDFDGDEDADLAIGEPYGDFSATHAAGYVYLYTAAATGFADTAPRVFSLHDTSSLVPGAEDNFGFALVALDAVRPANPLQSWVYLPLVTHGGAGQFSVEAPAD